MTALTPDQVQRLSEFLASPDHPTGTMSYWKLRGFLFALAPAPNPVQPSKWMPNVFGGDDPIYDSMDEAQETMGLLISVWNDVARVTKDRSYDEAWLLGGDPDDEAIRQQWSSGFLTGWRLESLGWDAALQRLSDRGRDQMEFLALQLGFFSDPEAYRAEMALEDDDFERLASASRAGFLEASYSYAEVGTAIFRSNLAQGQGVVGEGASRQGMPGSSPIRKEKAPGRNEPCPCGSGKKYKRCCLH